MKLSIVVPVNPSDKIIDIGVPIKGDNIPIIKKIESLFMTGRKFYAKELNELAHTNDARKFISDLRRAGVNIQDSWQPNGCKLYWVNLYNNRQLSFWERWEDVRYE